MHQGARLRPQSAEQMQPNRPARVSFELGADTTTLLTTTTTSNSDSPAPDTRATSASGSHHHQRSQTVTGANNNNGPNGYSLDAPTTMPGITSPGSGTSGTRGIGETLGGGGRGARPTNALVRAKSDHWLKHDMENAAKNDEEDEDFELRHGWQDEHNSSEYLKILNSVSCFTFALPSLRST